jgi:hypothetical protein
VDASGSAPQEPAGGAGAVSGSALTRPGESGQDGLPAGSGTGARVVYSVHGQQVWLVGADGRVLRTFRVAPGDTAPSAGHHHVFGRRAAGTGGDGRRVEHTVLFAERDGMNVGFSAALAGSPDDTDPAQLGPGIRIGRADADALWRFAMIGTAVEVVR